MIIHRYSAKASRRARRLSAATDTRSGASQHDSAACISDQPSSAMVMGMPGLDASAILIGVDSQRLLQA